MESAKTPLVSIILPVYNAKDHLARCIESIRAQTFRDFELILINDGSNDDVSLPICQMYQKVDPRILLVDKANAGVSRARNRGIELAAGKYLQFVDSDDYIAPDYTAHLVECAEKTQADLVIAYYYMVIPRGGASALREKGIVWAEKAAPAFAEKMRAKDELPPEVRASGYLAEGAMDKQTFALHLMDQPASFYYGVMWNKLYRRDLVIEHEIRCNPDISWSEDFLFNLSYIRWAERFYATERPGYYYVQNPNSLVHTMALDLPEMLSGKVMLFNYYRDLYEQLGLYEENKLMIAKYLVGVAESTAPTNPLVKSLGESVEAVREALAGEDIAPEADAAPARRARRGQPAVQQPVTVRAAAAADAGEICRLSAAELGYDWPEAALRRTLEAQLARPDGRIFVAEQGGRVVGFVHAADYTLLYAPPMKNILGLAVEKKCQRQGIGTALLDAVRGWAQESGAAGLRLDSGAQRRRAHAFYRDYGFNEEKKQLRFAMALGETPDAPAAEEK